MKKINKSLDVITIRELTEGYNDGDDSLGIPRTTMNGKLIVHASFNRAYGWGGDSVNKAVSAIETLMMGGTLGSVIRSLDTNTGIGKIVDGQHRVTAICKFVNNEFSVNGVSFVNMNDDDKQDFLDTEINVDTLIDADREQIAWQFKVTNQNVNQLSEMQILAAVYDSEWMQTLVKHYGNNVSKNSTWNSLKWSLSHRLSTQKLDGVICALRCLEPGETNLENIIRLHENKETIEQIDETVKKIYKWFEPYAVAMSNHPSFKVDDIPSADSIPVKYQQYHNKKCSPSTFIARIEEMIGNGSEISISRAIWTSIGNENVATACNRVFDRNMVIRKMLEQAYKCSDCGCKISLDGKHGKKANADHIKPYSIGGKTEYDNLQMLCESCNKKKSNKNLF